MSLKNKSKHILVELKGHAPFTLLGALLGIILMLVFRNAGAKGAHNLFMIFHPTHVVLSAMVTASMLRVHAWKKKFLTILVIGYFGSVGIATLSDVIIPHIGANLLGLSVPTHAQMHHHEDGHTDHEEKLAIHLGFIEEWYIVNPAALLGIFIAFFIPRTKFPHSAHVLLSTWASSSYLLMSIKSELTIAGGIGIFATLFIATWLPCCISDIIFPLLFVKPDVELAQQCADHGRHSHEHSYKQ
ncbi:hypothetical protein ACFL3G_11945 [Planctomycetota bacterium]